MDFSDNNSNRTIDSGNKLCDELINIAHDCIDEIEHIYKELPELGRFEVLLFNSLIVETVYKGNHQNIDSSFDADFFLSLLLKSLNFTMNLTLEELGSFIAGRLNFYSQEFTNITRRNGLPGKIYSAFYLTPLKKDPEIYQDPLEILIFFAGVQSMIKTLQISINQLEN